MKLRYKQPFFNWLAQLFQKVSGVPPLALRRARASGLAKLVAYGGLEQNGTPDPDTPVPLVCNNGTLKVLDKSSWTIFTNPTLQAGQGVYISADGKWCTADDNGAGCAIPLTIGKQYTLVIHKKTVSLGDTLYYGQSPQVNPTSAGVQLTDWYRGNITNGQMVSFVAKLPYLVMQLSSASVEAGLIQQAIEVLEAQGGDYTFLEYIGAMGTQYIQTTLSGPARWIGAGQGTSDSAGSKCILSARTTSANVYIASRFSNNATAGRFWRIGDLAGQSQTQTLNYAEYDIDFTSNLFTGTINGETVSRNNSLAFTTWTIGNAFGTGNVPYPFIGNIYRQQAYQNNVLAGDFIPAIRNSDNAVGIYDAVSGAFFENAGTGVFTAGPVIGSGEVLKLTPGNDTAGVANLLKIDNYADTQEILTGLINHQLGIYVFDGTEDWIWTNNADAPARLNIPELNYVLNTDVAPVICSHFIPAAWNNLSPTTRTIPYVAVNQTTVLTAKRLVFTTAWDANITDLASWKSWLAGQYSAGTPVIIVYPLATAQDEAALILQTMRTTAGDNTLEIVQASLPGLELSAEYKRH